MRFELAKRLRRILGLDDGASRVLQLHGDANPNKVFVFNDKDDGLVLPQCFHYPHETARKTIRSDPMSVSIGRQDPRSNFSLITR
jgi:hypothetical protein